MRGTGFIAWAVTLLAAAFTLGWFFYVLWTFDRDTD